MRATATLLLLCACYVAPSEVIDTPAAPPAASDEPAPLPPSPQHVACDMTKFSFTQELGCANDGWIEFCAEKRGAPTATALRAIAPQVGIYEGLRGHPGCDEMNDYLVSQ